MPQQDCQNSVFLLFFPRHCYVYFNPWPRHTLLDVIRFTILRGFDCGALHGWSVLFSIMCGMPHHCKIYSSVLTLFITLCIYPSYPSYTAPRWSIVTEKKFKFHQWESSIFIWQLTKRHCGAKQNFFRQGKSKSRKLH